MMDLSEKERDSILSMLNLKPETDFKTKIHRLDAKIEMPKYRSHKTVWALKIGAIAYITAGTNVGGAVITPQDTRYAPFQVDEKYIKKHEPTIGGYYIVYEDGYKSWSPAEPFEAGYDLI